MTNDAGPGTFVTGYAQPFCVAKGEPLAFMVHSEVDSSYRAKIVRLDRGPGGDGSPMVGLFDAEVEVGVQRTRPGSYVSVPDPTAVLNLSRSFTLHAFILPTKTAHGEQTVMGRWSDRPAGSVLLVDSGCLTLWIESRGKRHAVRLDSPLMQGNWYSVVARFDARSGTATLQHHPAISSTNSRFGPVAGVAGGATTTCKVPRGVRADVDVKIPFLITARWIGAEPMDPQIGAFFNGKIEEPLVFNRALGDDDIATLLGDGPEDRPGVVAQWDFALRTAAIGIAADRVEDLGPHALHGAVKNMPARAVAGHPWDGRETDFRVAPQQYAAIHFHDDDLEDALWEPTATWTVPSDVPSGLHALRLEGGGTTDSIPFVVRPSSEQPRSSVALLLPTATYLAYSNQVPVFEGEGFESGTHHVPIAAPLDLNLYAHPEFGFSAYDRHTDGSGIQYVSWRRPILNLRPGYLNDGAVWELPADLCLLDWLREMGVDYDVVTDDVLHHNGVAAIEPYRVVLTGTHPEYASEPMLDALESYVCSGGRLMYLGGNGFYWVVSFDSSKLHVMEVRKPSGSVPRITSPGEYRHSTTGEPGGLWKDRGCAPQKLVGVGFAAQGFDASGAYRAMPDSEINQMRWAFDGVRDRERIGNFGMVGNGAAGLELDRYDLALGSPPQAFVLASSYGHSDSYLHTADEVDVMGADLAGTYDPEVRADLVYFEMPGGGSVFSTGSIAWCSSLSHDGYDNDVSRITRNALDRFLATEW